MSKYYFVHTGRGVIYPIYNGRSIWEDCSDKVEFVVVKEMGPAMDHYKEAMDSAPSERQYLAGRLEFMANPSEYNADTCTALRRAAELLLSDEE